MKPYRIIPEPRGALRAERYLLNGRQLVEIGQELEPVRPVNQALVALVLAGAIAVAWLGIFATVLAW